MWCLPLCPPDRAIGYPQKYRIPRPVPENIEKSLVLEPAEQGQKICFQPTGKDAIQTTEELDRTGRQRKQVCSFLGSSVSYLHLALSHQDFRSKVDPTPIPYKSPSGLIGETESVPQVLSLQTHWITLWLSCVSLAESSASMMEQAPCHINPLMYL